MIFVEVLCVFVLYLLLRRRIDYGLVMTLCVDRTSYPNYTSNSLSITGVILSRRGLTLIAYGRTEDYYGLIV